MTKYSLILFLLLVGCADLQKNDDQVVEKNTQSAKIHGELGSGYLEKKYYEIALEEFNESVKFDPNYALAYNGLGMVYSALRQDDKADANFQRSLQLDPTKSEAHNNYGSFLCTRGRYDESIPHFLEAVKNPLYPTPQFAYMNAGLCSLRKNDVLNAEAYLRKALQIDPLLHAAAYQMALIEFNRNKFETARYYLRNSLIANPTAEVLWLGVRIARQLGDRDAEASQALELRRRYPDSDQTRALLDEKQAGSQQIDGQQKDGQ